MTQTIKKITIMEVEFSAAELSKINSVCNLLADFRFKMGDFVLENDKSNVVTVEGITQILDFLNAFRKTKEWKAHF